MLKTDILSTFDNLYSEEDFIVNSAYSGIGNSL